MGDQVEQAPDRVLREERGAERAIRQEVTALDVTSRAPSDVKNALDAIDQVLDERQQPKFRMVEEMMERRKLELVSRACLANRARQK